jgi:hypothetical protein
MFIIIGFHFGVLQFGHIPRDRHCQDSTRRITSIRHRRVLWTHHPPQMLLLPPSARP